MIMDSKKISELIRQKKKKMLEATPELVDTDAKPDQNPMDLYNTDQDGRIEKTLMSPHKIDARDTDLAQSEGDALSVGLTDEEKGRMKRLRGFIDTLELNGR